MTNSLELSRVVQLSDLVQGKKLTMDVKATAEECAALAARMGILELKSMQTKLDIKQTQTAGNYRIDGHIQAKLVQACGVTFQPVNEVIDETFVETLTTVEANLVPEDDVDGNDDVPVDLIQGDSFDAGEIVAQWLTLLLNPYPRSDAPDYEYNEVARTEDGEPVHTPFDVLGQLKKELKTEENGN